MAPTIVRTRNLRIVVYPKDHPPPHVHVLGPAAEAKFLIEDGSCFYARGFSEKALAEIAAFLKVHRNLLLEAWDEFQK